MTILRSQELGGGAVGGQEVQIIDENMHQSYNFKAVSLMKKRITVFKVSNDFHTQKHRVWHQKQVSCIKQSWISTPWSGSGPPTSHSWPSDQSDASENGPKWFPIPQNRTRTMSLSCSEAEIEFHSLKCFLSSYRPSTLFMAFRSIWGFLKLVPNDSSCLKTLVLPPNSRL